MFTPVSMISFTSVAAIYPGEYDFFYFGSRNFAGNFHGVFNTFAPAPATHVGYAAVGAEIVAAILYLKNRRGKIPLFC